MITWDQNMQTHFKLYTAVLAELLDQCICISSLLSLHFLKPLEFVQSFVWVENKSQTVLMEISFYSLLNKLLCSSRLCCSSLQQDCVPATDVK